MLFEFITLNRDAIIEATYGKATQALRPTRGMGALRNGVPVFLTQLSTILRSETNGLPSRGSGSIGDGATRDDGELLALGLSVSEVIHVYGDICQAVTELAIAQDAPITVEEFRILDQALDTAAADAVTEHARLTADKTSHHETERLGQLAHELRNRINTALLAFSFVRSGTVAVNGAAGAVLARSLTGLHALIESTVSEVRLAAGEPPLELISVRDFLISVAASADLLASQHRTRLSVDPIDATMMVEADPQLLMSVVMTLLENAFKFTPAGGSVVLRSRAQGNRVVIEVEDECGGFSAGSDLLHALADRPGVDRSGLGLGLSIARRAVHAHGGDIQVRSTPGKGCTFAVELPLAARPISEITT
jgi:signal transduction histidine kinase